MLTVAPILYCFLPQLPSSSVHSNSDNMNRCEEENSCCYLHPKEVIVGVCAFCLNERLLILASKQGHHPSAKDNSRSRIHNVLHKKPPITLPKFFAFGSFLHRLEFRHRKTDDSDGDASTSQEDSFISIKFEENGVASWDKGISSKVSLDPLDMFCNHNLKKEINKSDKSVVEHAKPRAATLRWRKRIGHLFQLIRRKRSSKANMCHVGTKVEGVKVRKGWIRTLTKRRNME
ncbi:hypothetical protein HHK36_008972 [Tetracentron sinense]|uniref:Uncharacterized protein n=1 Tax=Tetracentron sinense TaxID=13715 RepID=A0A834ZK08_TETSI|nr:hypothetical protein HHK36_008972 [Tetracentron sinense]